jgi:hypothetical protein
METEEDYYFGELFPEMGGWDDEMYPSAFGATQGIQTLKMKITTFDGEAHYIDVKVELVVA